MTTATTSSRASRRQMRVAAGLACTACWALPAWAGLVEPAPVFELTSRSALVSLLNINSGIGIAPTRIDAGAVFSDLLAPASLSLVGSDTNSAAASVFSSELQASWNIGQTYSLLDTPEGVSLSASGALQLQASAINCILSTCDSTTAIGYQSQNFQVFTFTLDADTAYAAQGASSRGQSVLVERFDDSRQAGDEWQVFLGWNSFLTYGGSPFIGPQQILDWQLAGSFPAGSYRIRNGPDGYGNVTYPINSWAYTLNLAGADIAPVPEPAAWLLMATGLAVLSWRRRPSR